MSDNSPLGSLGSAMNVNTDVSETSTSSKPTLFVPWFGMSKPRKADLFTSQPMTPNQADRLAAEQIATGAQIATETGQPNPYTSGSVVQAQPHPGFDYLSPKTGASAYRYSAGELSQTAAPTGDGTGGGMVLRDAATVALDVYNWTADERNAVAKRMVDVGMIGEQWSPIDVVKAWGELVTEAANYHLARPGDLMTPMDMLDLNHGDGTATGKAVPHVSKIVDKSVTITTAEDARAVLNSVLSDKLGRRANSREVDDFQAALNSAQRSNPTVQTTHSTTSADGSRVTSRSGVQVGGVNVNNFADNYTDNRDPDSEFGRYQAATTYYNALLKAVQGPVPQR